MLAEAPLHPYLYEGSRLQSKDDVDHIIDFMGELPRPDHTRQYEQIIRVNQKAKKNTLILAAPGHLKSSTIGLLILQDLLGEDPHILMGSRAKDVITVTNNFLRNGVRKLWPGEVERRIRNVQGFLWREDAFMVPTWRPVTKFPSWYGITTGAAFEGMRFKGNAYLDDPVDRTSQTSAAYRKDALNWYDNTFSARLAEGTTITAIGSTWHPNDFYMELIARNFDTHIFPMKRCEKPRIYDKYENVHWYGENYDWLWPEKWGKTDWDKFQREHGGSIPVKIRYLCNPEALKDNRFKAEWFLYYTDIPPEVQARMVVYIGVDPATGKGLLQDAKQDRLSLTGITVIGHDPFEAVIYVLACVGEFLDPVATKARIKALTKEYHPVRILVEDVGYQVALIKELVDSGLPAFPQSVESRDKISRIDTLAVPIEQGRIVFHRSQQDLVEELLYFPGSEHLDRCDSLEIAAREVLRHEPEKMSSPAPIQFFRDPGYTDWHDRDSGGDSDESI